MTASHATAAAHLLDAARLALAASAVRAAAATMPEWAAYTARETARHLGAEAVVSATLGAAHLVADLAVLCGYRDAGAGDLDGDASGPDESDAACVAPEGAGVHVVDVVAGAADEERLGQSRERSG